MKGGGAFWPPHPKRLADIVMFSLQKRLQLQKPRLRFFSSLQICNLEEQLEQFKEELENKSEEVQQLHMQLEIQRKEMSSQQQHQQTRESMLQVSQNLLPLAAL